GGFVTGQTLSDYGVGEGERLAVLERPVLAAHHAQHRLGVGADVGDEVFGRDGTPAVGGDGLNWPLVHPPIQAGRADGFVTVGRTLDVTAQSLPRRRAGGGRGRDHVDCL